MSVSYQCLVVENTVLHYILISTQKQAVRNLYSLVALWLSCAATACSDIILIYLSTLWTLPNIGLS